jgi:RNA polymerase sigma-70 factor (ECF subfamily)
MREKERTEIDADYGIVCRCQKGDIDAFEELVRKYEKKMFNISYRMIGDYNEVPEVVQDAFVSAWRNIKGFKWKSSFSTWLYAIAINLSKNRLKQIKNRTFREQLSIDDPVDTDDGQIRTEPASNDLSILEKLERREIEQKVQACINSLENDFREVIVLRDIQGFSYEEISAMLKTAEGTVKSRLHRARESVKNCLKKTIGLVRQVGDL